MVDVKSKSYIDQVKELASDGSDIADIFYKPWFVRSPHLHYAVVLPFDFEYNGAFACMNEDEVLAGLDDLEHEFPPIKAWITLYPIHIALYMKWQRVARRLGEWMTRRMMYFTPGGEYSDQSQSIYECEHPIDEPCEAFGECNLPQFLRSRDILYSNIVLTNADLFIKRWLETTYDHTERESLIELFGYIWASNSMYWCKLEGQSFYSDYVRNILRMVAHTKNYTTIMRLKHWQNYDKRQLLVHTGYTKCRFCPSSIESNITISTITDFERVLEYAFRLRARRLRGLFFCAARLIPKARAVRYVPGIGSYYKEAAAQFQKNCLNGSDRVPAPL